MYICNSQAIKNKLNYFWSVVMEKERKKQRKNYIFTLYIIYNNNKKKSSPILRTAKLRNFFELRK